MKTKTKIRFRTGTIRCDAMNDTNISLTVPHIYIEYDFWDNVFHNHNFLSFLFTFCYIADNLWFVSINLNPVDVCFLLLSFLHEIQIVFFFRFFCYHSDKLRELWYADGLFLGPWTIQAAHIRNNCIFFFRLETENWRCSETIASTGHLRWFGCYLVDFSVLLCLLIESSQWNGLAEIVKKENKSNKYISAVDIL